VICAACGADNPARARFCLECGSPLGGAAASPAVRKTVTVLFCDVVGSTRLGESADPEAVRELLARFFDAMRRIVEAHGGVVEKFIGDAVMAVFGVPQVHEDDALRAVRAALEMRAALPAVGVQARFGINTGEVVSGTRERLATGDAVNVAARLQQAAEPGEIVLGGSTLRLVRRAVDVARPQHLQLKGKADLVEAYRLLAVREEAAARDWTGVFIGRERERRLLREAFDLSVSDRACHLFSLLGAAGVGKSRLVAEFLGGVDATVAHGRCLPYGEGITYWPLAEAVRGLAPQMGALTPGVAGALRGVLGEGDQANTEEIAVATRTLFEQAGRVHPLVVVWDDLQWAEPTFLDLVDQIADWSRDAPILLLCMARPELLDLRRGWGGGKLRATTALLEPLSDEHCAALLERLAPTLGADVRARVLRDAGGNPLYVQEMVAFIRESPAGRVTVPPTITALLEARLDQLAPAERTALQCGAIEGVVFHGSAVAALGGDVGELSRVVRTDLIRPEHGTLPDDDAFRFRHILVRDAAYAALPKATRAELHRRFAGWLEERGSEMPEMDEIVGYHLEQAHALATQVGALAGDVDEVAARAGGRLGAAGRRASERDDVPAALNLLTRAIALLPVDSGRRRAALIDLGYALLESGSFERALDVFRDAADTAGRAGDAAVEARARVGLVVSEQRGGGSEAGVLDTVRSQIATLERLGDDAGLAEAWEQAATIETWLGRTAQASDAFERARRHSRRSAHRRLERRAQASQLTQDAWGHLPVGEGLRICDEVLAEAEGTALEPYVLAARALHRSYAGDADGARSDVCRARELLAAFGHQLMALVVAQIQTCVELRARDAGAAEAAARPAYEELERLGDYGFRSTLGGYLAEALLQQGRLDEAEAIADAAARAASTDDFSAHGVSLSVRARILARRGDWSAAERLARAAVETLAASDYYTTHGDALAVLADILEGRGQTTEARACRMQALALYERKGATPDADRLRVRLAAEPHGGR
jgi:class 3 adenylate cyclase/tetratricopeptide (TPR) repeat protein